MDNVEGFYRQFGLKIRQLREKKKLTQASLAGILSLSRTSITNIEKGRQRFFAHTIWEFSRALGVSPAELFPDLKSSDVNKIKASLSRLSSKDKQWVSAIIGKGGIYANPEKTDSNESGGASEKI